jgi:hypothetical protein
LVGCWKMGACFASGRGAFTPGRPAPLAVTRGSIGLVVGRFSTTPLLKEQTTVAVTAAAAAAGVGRSADEVRRGGWVGVNKTAESSHQQIKEITRHACPMHAGRTRARGSCSQTPMYDTGVAATTLN